MRELLILLVIIVVIAVIAYFWYQRQKSTKPTETRKVNEIRKPRAEAAAGDRASLATAATASGGLLQQAADFVAGKKYEESTDQMQEKTAELTQARQDAERAAARLSDRAEEALAIQTAAAAHGGALPGDGTSDCPSAYPIKGNAKSMLYHQPESATYGSTVPEFCFSSVESAVAAGFSSPMREKTAELTQARQDAERSAANFSIQSEDALAIQTAAEPHGGALPGDGTRDCPSAYPIKGNQSSMLYHEPGTPTYVATIAEFCFSSAGGAKAAGFSATEH